MSAYNFAPLPSNNSIAGLVTFLVSAWFLVAAAAIVTEPSKGPLQALAAAAPVEIAPQARLTITVEAQRLPASATL